MIHKNRCKTLLCVFYSSLNMLIPKIEIYLSFPFFFFVVLIISSKYIAIM